jgi:hypothetical protein
MRMAARHFIDAVGNRDEEAEWGKVAREEAQEIKTRSVCPVQIIQE